MEPSTKPPILDYATGERGVPWPCALLFLLGTIGIVLAPSVACACWRGEYKMYLAILGSGALLLRTLIAALVRERGFGWIPYLLLAVVTLLFGPMVIDAVF